MQDRLTNQRVIERRFTRIHCKEHVHTAIGLAVLDARQRLLGVEAHAQVDLASGQQRTLRVPVQLDCRNLAGNFFALHANAVFPQGNRLVRRRRCEWELARPNIGSGVVGWHDAKDDAAKNFGQVRKWRGQGDLHLVLAHRADARHRGHGGLGISSFEPSLDSPQTRSAERTNTLTGDPVKAGNHIVGGDLLTVAEHVPAQRECPGQSVAADTPVVGQCGFGQTGC